MKRIFLLLLAIAALTVNALTQSGELNKPVVIAVSEKILELDTLTNSLTAASADRVRTLIYNSLVKKNEKFEYVGELGDYKIGNDNLTVTFTLKDNIKFHNGKFLNAADVKYTFDALFQANAAKAASFYDSVPGETDPQKKRVSHFADPIATPDAKTVVFKVTRPELVNRLLSNLVAIPIIPEGTVEEQKSAPIGSGAFKFVGFDQSESLVELEAFLEYWEGAPKIQKLIVKTVSDASALQAELLSGGVDISPNPTILSPDDLEMLARSANLKVEKFFGSNIQYLGFNTRSAPFDSIKVRQAAAYAIDREKIINNILGGRARIAHSILPAESWASKTATQHAYDPAKARRLLKAAGYKGRLVKFTYFSGNQTLGRQAQIIQTMLKEIGFNIEIEAMEPSTLIEKLKRGEFQINIGTWIGGNQDPAFYRDLFASAESPEKKTYGRNRARYSNPEFDKIIEEAARTTDRTRAKELYARAQEIISRDVPLLPLWYPSNIVVSNKRIKNITIKPGGDWGFVRFIEPAD
jgi:peptide/nickel transport system substrate-binding protein